MILQFRHYDCMVCKWLHFRPFANFRALCKSLHNLHYSPANHVVIAVQRGFCMSCVTGMCMWSTSWDVSKLHTNICFRGCFFFKYAGIPFRSTCQSGWLGPWYDLSGIVYELDRLDRLLEGSKRPDRAISRDQEAESIKICHLTSIGNPIVEIRLFYDRLISTMGFPILVRWHLYIESRPSSFTGIGSKAPMFLEHAVARVTPETKWGYYNLGYPGSAYLPVCFPIKNTKQAAPWFWLTWTFTVRTTSLNGMPLMKICSIIYEAELRFWSMFFFFFFKKH